MSEQAQQPESADAAPDTLEVPSAERRTLLAEFGAYLMENKKWWMIPIVVMVALVGLVLVAVSNPALQPFIYTLF